MPSWLILAEVLSLGCGVHLWAKTPASIARKIVWTPVVLLPVLGPLFYGGFFSVPPVQEESLRASENHFDD